MHEHAIMAAKYYYQLYVHLWLKHCKKFVQQIHKVKVMALVVFGFGLLDAGWDKVYIGWDI